MSEAIRALMQGFGKKLPGRLRKLDEALSLARAGDPEALGVARRLAHRLHGTAGSYGYAQVSSAAGALEAALDCPAPEWSAVDAAHASVSAAIHAAEQNTV